MSTTTEYRGFRVIMDDHLGVCEGRAVLLSQPLIDKERLIVNEIRVRKDWLADGEEPSLAHARVYEAMQDQVDAYLAMPGNEVA